MYARSCVHVVRECVHVTVVMGKVFVVGMSVGQKRRITQEKRPSTEAKETHSC